MKPLADYHMHTHLCGHATGDVEEYVESGINKGLKEIGFSDHAPLVAHEDPTIAMDLEDLPRYHKMIEKAREKYKDRIKVKIGIESDFFVGYENKTKEILERYNYDYVIGSVHYINDWGFDHPNHINRWKEFDINDVYIDYHNHLRMCADSGLFDIIGHVDLIKKFGHRATVDLSGTINETAEVFKEKGVAIEINTSGLRKAVEEIYPSLFDLKIYSQYNVPIVFGSDSHAPNQVAMDFDKAYDLAKEAGYNEYVLFKNRNIERILPL